MEKYCKTYDKYQCLLKYFLHLSSTFWTSKFKKEIDLFVPLSNCEFLQEKETYLVHLILIKPQNLDHYARTTCPPALNVKNDGNHNTCKMVKRSSFKKSESFFFFAKALLYIREMFQCELLLCRAVIHIQTHNFAAKCNSPKEKNHFLKC